jgi:predicted nucleic acid-binding protein
MPPARSFLDTNILVYAFSEGARAEVAQSLLVEPFILSVQALNEFSNVGRKKLGMSWSDIEYAVADLITMSASIVPLDEQITVSALDLAQRYNLAFYDALMVAAACSADCERFYSEDLHAGLVIDARLTVVNPFR